MCVLDYRLLAYHSIWLATSMSVAISLTSFNKHSLTIPLLKHFFKAKKKNKKKQEERLLVTSVLVSL